ncbi:MAG: glycosyltransferase family 4 protein [Acidimicrobiales bacterium]
MTRAVSISLDQFYRPQPGGIATYVRGLVRGLNSLQDDSLRLVGVAPRGVPKQDLSDLALERVTTAPLNVLNLLWARWPLGVPSFSDVVHATSLAGPFAGGKGDAVHSVALYDLLWRDEPEASTSRGIRFHEQRLQLLKRQDDVRIFCTAPQLSRRLISDGFDPSRLHDVRLGVDDDDTTSANAEEVRIALSPRGVRGPYTLYVGTREPRKNLERLIVAHSLARKEDDELGPLVLVGPSGWGSVDSAEAIVLGSVSRSLLKGLYRDATVVAYVPKAEGWGLPPVEALHEGARVVASVTTPSVTDNEEVVLVDPLDVEAIAKGLVASLSRPNDAAALERRRASVSSLTWRNVALDHLAGWQ